MSGVNKVILLGRLGKDPEVRNLNNSQKVANFSIAVTESHKDKTTGQKKENTEWVNLVLWNGLAELAGRYLHKGDQCYFEGRLRTRKYEKNGSTQYTTEVHVESLTMLGNSQDRNAAQNNGDDDGFWNR